MAVNHADGTLFASNLMYPATAAYASIKTPLVSLLNLLAITLICSAIVPANAQELSKAVLASDEPRVRQLLADGIDVNSFKAGSAPPIFFAENLRILDLLIENGARFDDLIGRETPLELAASSGLLDVVSALRKRGARYTLKAAILLNDLEFLKSELSSKPEIANETLNDGELPLSVSVESGTVEASKILLEHGADPSGSVKGRPVILSALDSPESLKLLIEKGANLRRRIPIRNEFILGIEPSVLHFAMLQGNLEVIKICVKAGLDVNATDANGLSILGLGLLLSSEEASPLIARPNRPNTEIIRFLLDNDVSLSLLARGKFDAVDFAIELKCPKEIIDILKKGNGKASEPLS